MIIEGRVTVDGRVAQLGDRASVENDIRIDGQPVVFSAQKSVTYVLNKPKGVVTTARDEYGRPGVLDLMPKVPGLHTVGRLDRDSEGLLLLTTDGDLTLQMTHPRYAHEKEYRVWTDREVTAEDVFALERGVDLEEGWTLPAEVAFAPGGLYITLREGRNRQIRRMLSYLGYTVHRLLRVRLAGLVLGDLEPGEYRELSPEELLLLTGNHFSVPSV